jgi:hypothetical protein
MHSLAVMGISQSKNTTNLINHRKHAKPKLAEEKTSMLALSIPKPEEESRSQIEHHCSQKAIASPQQTTDE